jgi:geranylgeranyl diphosphate synthase type II
MKNNSNEKISLMITLFRDCGVDQWAAEQKEKYTRDAFQHLEDIAVLSSRKKPLADLASFLLGREF